MRKDMSEEAFRAVEDAANRILDYYGQHLPDRAHIEYQAGNLVFARHDIETWITYMGHEVFHAYPQWSDREVSTFYPDDWIDEVEQILQTIPDQR